MIERLILTGLINSTEYLKLVRFVWNNGYIASRSAYMIAEWCIEFYDQYKVAPERNIEDVYFDKKKAKQIPKDMVEEVENDLLDLTDEYEEDFNVKYALDQTAKYFKERHLELHREQVEKLIQDGDTDAAQALASSYRGLTFELTDDLDLGKGDVLDKIDNAFLTVSMPLLEYPGALGEMLNDQMVRSGFVALMAAEKRGKTWWLMDMAIRAAFHHSKVAFFQAGDMTERQLIKRISCNLSSLPMNKKYIGEIYSPHADCLRNQLDLCDKEERRCGFPIFTEGEYDEVSIREELIRDDLIEAWKDVGNTYTPCTNCSDHASMKLGVPFLVPKKVNDTITAERAKKEISKFFIKKKRSFKISTHPNNTLTVRKIMSILERWEMTDGFIPSVIAIDYADLLVPEKQKEFRHQQNDIWKDLRRLSQELDCLVLTATQADAKAYVKKTLDMTNYSEDKRKFAHVTAMYGLNQDKYDREKKLGIMRLNELAIREGEFSVTNSVTVLQNLTLGRPYLDSYV